MSRKYIFDCVKASLERLQMEFIDVVVVHRVDSSCPMEGKPILCSHSLQTT